MMWWVKKEGLKISLDPDILDEIKIPYYLEKMFRLKKARKGKAQQMQIKWKTVT